MVILTLSPKGQDGVGGLSSCSRGLSRGQLECHMVPASSGASDAVSRHLHMLVPLPAVILLCLPAVTQ